jgi:Uma2 family endonuclease
MGVTALVAVADYLRTAYRPDCEYVEGRIVRRHVGEVDHSRLQAALVAWFFSREKELGIRVLPEQRVQVSPVRFRVPDVCVVLGNVPKQPVLTQPPFLCIEILSRDDTIQEMQERIDDYLRFGVAHVWMIHPRARRAWTCTHEGNFEARGGRLRTEAPEIELPLPEIFDSMALD